MEAQNEEKKETSKKTQMKQRLESIWGTINDFKEQATTGGKVKSVLKGDILHNSLFANNKGLFLVIILLSFIYVGIRYYVEGDIKHISELQDTLKDVRIEDITRSSELIDISKRSAVVRSANDKGLHLIESQEPPILVK